MSSKSLKITSKDILKKNFRDFKRFLKKKTRFIRRLFINKSKQKELFDEIENILIMECLVNDFSLNIINRTEYLHFSIDSNIITEQVYMYIDPVDKIINTFSYDRLWGNLFSYEDNNEVKEVINSNIIYLKGE